MANVNIITKKVILPTDIIVFTDNDAPKRMIAIFRTFLDVNLSAGFIHVGWKKMLINVPINKAIMDAPSNSPGISLSTNTDKPATAKHMATPSRNIPCCFVFVSIIYLH